MSLKLHRTVSYILDRLAVEDVIDLPATRRFGTTSANLYVSQDIGKDLGNVFQNNVYIIFRPTKRRSGMCCFELVYVLFCRPVSAILPPEIAGIENGFATYC